MSGDVHGWALLKQGTMVSPGTLIKQNTLGRESPVLPELPDAASPCIHQNHHIHLSFGVWSQTSYNTIEDAHGLKIRNWNNCNYCKYIFPCTTKLKMHMGLKFAKKIRKWNNCNYCKYQFLLTTKIKMHMGLKFAKKSEIETTAIIANVYSLSQLNWRCRWF